MSYSNFEEDDDIEESSQLRGLYIDDVRALPKDKDVCWIPAYNFHEAVYLLQEEKFDIVSFDHDIASFYGGCELKGKHILLWLTQAKMDWVEGATNTILHVPKEIRIHSANSVGVPDMLEIVEKYWS